MLKKTIAVSSLPILLILMVCFSSCGKQDEPVQEPEIKSFKIEKTTKPDAPTASGVETPPAVAPAPMPKPESGSPIPSPAPGTTPGAAPPPGLIPPPAAAAAAPLFALGSDIKTESETTYSPVGRIDPFEPLFKTKTNKGESGGIRQQTIRDARKGKLTPLENLDISQMKLTAIIVGPHQRMAMVQESTGKGHVIKKGTFIGINSGRVVDIRQNEVIIEEEVEDLLGKIIVRKRELKLQKPLGEM